MNTKKQKRDAAKSRAKQLELKKDLTSTQGQLARTEKKLEKAANRTERWKKEAKVQRRSADQAGARAKKLQRKLDRASTVLEPAVGASHSGSPDKVGDTARTKTPSAKATASADAKPAATGTQTPDKTWTVVQLRAAATSRGMTGMSNKPKAQLLAALS